MVLGAREGKKKPKQAPRRAKTETEAGQRQQGGAAAENERRTRKIRKRRRGSNQRGCRKK